MIKITWSLYRPNVNADNDSLDNNGYLKLVRAVLGRFGSMSCMVRGSADSLPPTPMLLILTSYNQVP
jgi:hypothetical protein